MRPRTFIQEQDLVEDAFRLGVQIFNDGFVPTFVVGLWRGGSTVGIYVQECLQYLGIDTNHIALRTSYRGVQAYDDMVSNPADNIRVHGTQYLLETLNKDDRLLIVDDVSGSGLTLKVVAERLRSKLKRNMPDDVRTAAIWYRQSDNKTGAAPDYYLHETSQWLVLPYEMTGLTRGELDRHKPFVSALLADAVDAE
ncbi:MAG: phosphoribosyltransferase family protein [Pseudomonadota bacterium]